MSIFLIYTHSLQGRIEKIKFDNVKKYDETAEYQTVKIQRFTKKICKSQLEILPEHLIIALSKLLRCYITCGIDPAQGGHCWHNCLSMLAFTNTNLSIDYMSTLKYLSTNKLYINNMTFTPIQTIMQTSIYNQQHHIWAQFNHSLSIIEKRMTHCAHPIQSVLTVFSHYEALDNLYAIDTAMNIDPLRTPIHHLVTEIYSGKAEFLHYILAQPTLLHCENMPIQNMKWSATLLSSIQHLLLHSSLFLKNGKVIRSSFIHYMELVCLYLQGYLNTVMPNDSAMKIENEKFITDMVSVLIIVYHIIEFMEYESGTVLYDYILKYITEYQTDKFVYIYPSTCLKKINKIPIIVSAVDTALGMIPWDTLPMTTWMHISSQLNFKPVKLLSIIFGIVKIYTEATHRLTPMGIQSLIKSLNEQSHMLNYYNKNRKGLYHKSISNLFNKYSYFISPVLVETRSKVDHNMQHLTKIYHILSAFITSYMKFFIYYEIEKTILSTNIISHTSNKSKKEKAEDKHVEISATPKEFPIFKRFKSYLINYNITYHEVDQIRVVVHTIHPDMHQPVILPIYATIFSLFTSILTYFKVESKPVSSTAFISFLVPWFVIMHETALVDVMSKFTEVEYQQWMLFVSTLCNQFNLFASWSSLTDALSLFKSLIDQSQFMHIKETKLESDNAYIMSAKYALKLFNALIRTLKFNQKTGEVQQNLDIIDVINNPVNNVYLKTIKHLLEYAENFFKEVKESEFIMNLTLDKNLSAIIEHLSPSVISKFHRLQRILIHKKTPKLGDNKEVKYLDRLKNRLNNAFKSDECEWLEAYCDVYEIYTNLKLENKDYSSIIESIRALIHALSNHFSTWSSTQLYRDISSGKRIH